MKNKVSFDKFKTLRMESVNSISGDRVITVKSKIRKPIKVLVTDDVEKERDGMASRRRQKEYDDTQLETLVSKVILVSSQNQLLYTYHDTQSFRALRFR